jgi:hypothetical protein
MEKVGKLYCLQFKQGKGRRKQNKTNEIINVLLENLSSLQEHWKSLIYFEIIDRHH